MLSRQEGNVLPQLPDERSVGSAAVIRRPPVDVTHSYVGTMVELAFYPAVALIYFFGVLQAHKDERVNLPDSASVNVFCLFVLIQPLCLIIGGYTGMATYLISAYVSYSVLPWKKQSAAQQEDTEKKKKRKTKTN